jgi:Protein of unknown function (DUF1524)
MQASGAEVAVALSGRIALAILALVALTGCTATVGLPPITSSGASAPPQGSAVAALGQLRVQGRAPKTGYTREMFGQQWRDVDRNGCDQRNDVLARDLVDTTFKTGTGDCVVLSGTLHDPYTGRSVAFVRGPNTSDDIQIDHVVALSDAWQTGAQQLGPTARELLANDPLNLIATAGAVNQAKGDSNAASWLPPERAAWCPYVARQVAVKTTYRLWITPAERDTIAGILAGCPTQPLPTTNV